MKYVLLMFAMLLGSQTAFAQNPPRALSPSIAEGLKNTGELEKLRSSRQLSIVEIQHMLKDKNTILLDTRGDEAFKRIHIRGAKHLSYADMTTEKLAELIPDKTTRVIVYCDAAILSPLTRIVPLSTHAFADLHAYGYTNLYEMRHMNAIQPYQAQCREMMDIPFAGNPQAVSNVKQSAVQCLSR